MRVRPAVRARHALPLALALLAAAAPASAAPPSTIDLPCRLYADDPGAVETFCFASLADGFLVADLAAGRIALFSPDGKPTGERSAPGCLAACADVAGGALLLFAGAVERHASSADLAAGKPGKRTPLAGFAPAHDPSRYRLAASPDGALFVHDRAEGTHRIFDAAGRDAGDFPGDGPVLPLSAAACLDAPCDPDAGLLVTELIVGSDGNETAEERDTLHLRAGSSGGPGAAPVAADPACRKAWLLAPSPEGEGEPSLRLLRLGPGDDASTVATFPFAPVEGFFTARGGTLWVASPGAPSALSVRAVALGDAGR